VMALPTDAIVEVGNEFFVLLQTTTAEGAYRFEKMNMEAGRSQNGYTEVLNPGDFPEGAKFLTKGAFSMLGE
ncbi:MAG: efflux RND transporter periplasmic adaptor subunit, partial [Bacteroidia bacterium]|nr:efflux RND transporter periplasmic adaptor subunit [Bacteroidia bacterium]